VTATTNYDASGRTLCIQYRERSDHDIEQALAAIDRGETPEPHLEIVYHDPEDIHRVTRPELLKILRAIVQHDPDSIRETARLVKRDVGQVHRNLPEFEELHLVEIVDAGQSKRPPVWYEAIDIDLPLVTPDVGSDEATM